MQKILHQIGYKSIHPIFDELEQFYTLTSTKATQNINSLIIPVYDYSFEYLCRIFEEFGMDGYNNYPIKFIDKEYSTVPLKLYDKKNLILIFSGGKDSTAAILHYKKLGYKIYLFHALGINKSYPDEWKRAKDIAEYLDLPIHFEKFEFEGKQEFPDHPMKNMLIASRALQWGIENNISIKIACGNYYTTGIDKDAFYYSGNDSIVTWRAFEDIIKTVIPKFKMYVGLKDQLTTYKLLSQDIKLLSLCQSCVGALRFREWNKKNNETKYGIKLLPNRCGSCWKCAAEYIYMTDYNILEYNEEYYKHCLKILKKNRIEEHGLVYNIDKMWQQYLGYDIKKSKYKDILNFK